MLEAQGRPARQAHYFNNRAALRARQNRHRVDEETIALIRRAAAAAARETGDEANIAWMTAGLGWTLVMAEQYDEAQRLVEGSWRRGSGSVTLYCRGRCLMALTVAAVRRHGTRMPSVPLRHGPWWTAVLMALPPKWHCATPVSPGWHGRTAARRHHHPRHRGHGALYRTDVGTFSYLKWLGLFPLIAVHLTAGTGERGNCSCAARYLSLLNNGYRTTCGQP